MERYQRSKSIAKFDQTPFETPVTSAKIWSVIRNLLGKNQTAKDASNQKNYCVEKNKINEMSPIRKLDFNKEL
jgi:hypothetical protein